MSLGGNPSRFLLLESDRLGMTMKTESTLGFLSCKVQSSNLKIWQQTIDAKFAIVVEFVT